MPAKDPKAYAKNYYNNGKKVDILYKRHINQIISGMEKSIRILNEHKITLNDFYVSLHDGMHPETLKNLKAIKGLGATPCAPCPPCVVVAQQQTPPPILTLSPVQQRILNKPITKEMVVNKLTEMLVDVIDKTKPENSQVELKTFNTYRSRLNTLNKAGGCNNDLRCLSDYDKTIKSLNAYRYGKENTPLSDILPYISSIIGISNRVDFFKQIFTVDTLDRYRKIQQKKSVKVEEKQKFKTTNEIAIPFSEIEKFAETHKDTDETLYLLANIYIKLPYLRDNVTNLKIIDVKLTPKSKTLNFYNTKTNQFILNKYKNSGTKQVPLTYEVPKKLTKILKDSLEKHPRDYLITKNKLQSNEPYAALSALVKKSLGNTYNINKIRHSYSSHIYKQLKDSEMSLVDFVRLVKLFSHSLQTHLMVYVREKNDTKTLEDVKAIDPELYKLAFEDITKPDEPPKKTKKTKK